MPSLSEMLKEVNSTETLMINSALDAILLTDNGNREERTGMHGSGLIVSDNDFCYRQQVLSFFFKGNEVPISTGLRRIFLNGWFVHEKWQKLFVQAGIAEGIEQRGESNEWRLLFTPDATIRIGRRTYVVEIKSVNTYQFKSMTSHPSGHKQLQLYMHMTGIPYGFVLCEDKNTQEIKIFVYEYDPVVARPFVERMHKVRTLIARYEKSGKLPARICDKQNCKKANGCSYKDACFGIKRVPIK